MTRLSPKDFDAFQRATLALHECRDLPAFRRAVPELVLGVIPVDHFFLQQVAFSPSSRRPRLVDTVDPSGQVTPEMARFSEAALLDHPFPKYFASTGDWSALILSVFQSVHQFRRTEIYQQFYQKVSVNRLMGVPTNFGRQNIGGISLGNCRRDFSERDRLLLNLLRPHIELAHRNAARWTALQSMPPAANSIAALTPREREVARWLAAGKTNWEISVILDAKVRTVEKHVEKILEKLRVENRTAAAAALASQPPQKQG